MSELYRDDFTGFFFNGIHSSELNIIRTSNGDRYEQSLSPSFEDKNTQVPGKDGMYYFGSTYTSKEISIDIAYDNVSESQIRQIEKLFNDKNIHPLIFDEFPYKQYMAKISDAPNLTYICFDKLVGEEYQRVYKGEGTLNFIAYEPFAQSVYKYLNEYSEELYPTKWQWAAASGMLENSGDYDVYNTTNKWFKIYNAGDLDANWELIIPLTNNSLSDIEIYITDGISIDYKKYMKIIGFSNQNCDAIKLDSKTRLIKGMLNGQENGILFNQYLSIGDFFKIPVMNQNKYFKLSTDQVFTANNCKLNYRYYYY